MILFRISSIILFQKALSDNSYQKRLRAMSLIKKQTILNFMGHSKHSWAYERTKNQNNT